MQGQVINKGKSAPGTGSETKELPPFEFKKQSMISLSMSDMVLTNITVKYEYFTKDGKVGYQIPFSFNAGGLPDTNNYRTGNAGRFLSARNRVFQTGLNLNYYVSGQGKVSPFVGLSFAAGWFYYWKYNYTYSGPPAYNNSFTNEKLIANNYSFAFHGGFLFNPWETLTFGIKAGVGLRRYGTIYQEYTIPFGLVDFSAGFKF
jgi:hypothetical protein